MELRAGDLEVGLAPEIGGSVAYFRAGGVNLMRPLSAPAREAKDVLGVAMFPMTPYANRVANNCFSFEGRVWRVAPNNPPDLFNVHGTGWRAAWDVERYAASEALLALNYDEPNEPYSYRATQHIVLTSKRLEVTTLVSNRGRDRMPFGLGQHPWFERDRDVELSFEASHFLLEGPHGTPTDALITPPELDFSKRRQLPSTWRNNCYSGWQGKAEIRYPSRGLGLRIEADPIFRNLMLYADPERPYFCVEPQTNVSGALNRLERQTPAELGIVVLNPGESVQGRVIFEPFGL